MLLMNEAIAMLEKFIDGKYDPLAFSFEFPDYLVNHYEEMNEENKDINSILNEDLPDICAEYERAMDPTEFIKKVRNIYSALNI